MNDKRASKTAKKRRLYVSDLDGTLLRNDASISGNARAILNTLLKDGLLFTVASARSVFTIREVLKGVHLRLPVIEINGAFVSEMGSGRHLVINDIDPSALPTLYASIHEHGCFPIIVTFDGQRDRLYYDRPHNRGMEKVIANRIQAKDVRLSQTNNLENALADHVVCFTVIGMEAELSALFKEMNERLNSSIKAHLFRDIYSEYHWLTIQDKSASKDRAIKSIIRQYDLFDCDIVVFGDNDNDLSMFQIADKSIAVENATPSLKQYATETIASNQKESVVQYLQLDFAG